MATDTVLIRLADTPERVEAILSVLQACASGAADRSEVTEAVARAGSAADPSDLATPGDSALRLKQHPSSDGKALEIRIEGGSYEMAQTWPAWSAFLESLALEELVTVYSHHATGGFEIALVRGKKLVTYATGSGGKNDDAVHEALIGPAVFDRLWELERGRKLRNPNTPHVGKVVTRVLAKLGYLDPESKAFAKARKIKSDLYQVLAAALPESYSSFSPRLDQEASKLLELVEAHARVAPGWTLEDASIEVTASDDGTELDPAHDVQIRFRSFGEDFTWAFKHQPYTLEPGIRELIRDLCAEHLAGEFVAVKGGGVLYARESWHKPVLRAVAPPERLLEILERNKVDAFYALSDRVGSIAMEFAVELPDRFGQTPQDFMEAHPENDVARVWASLSE